MKGCMLLILFFTCNVLRAQSDFIILKKGSKTIRTYFQGSNIEFMTTTGIYRNGLINKIKHDSIYLQEFLVRQVMTTLGFYVIDTAGSFRYIYHYNQVKSIGREQKNFNWKGSGAALLGGGTLLTLASGISYLADKDKFSPSLMAASAGLALAGYFMGKGGKGIVIGKKNYKLLYMSLSN
ncbi:MAG TPA: hypothetical protein VK498_11885 [Ferruginibacter sp.]|nr:hypothetical protein [Ferruginibacter sp.]